MSTTENDVQTGTTLEPGDLGELRDAVVDSTGPLVVRGGGTASDWVVRSPARTRCSRRAGSPASSRTTPAT